MGDFPLLDCDLIWIWRCQNSQAEINRMPSETNNFEADSFSPLQSLRRVMAESAMEDTGKLPPMSAGLSAILATI